MDIRKVAQLARLQLNEVETTQLATQLADILRYVEQVQAVDTTGVTETSQPLPHATAWRDDTPRPSLPNAEALAAAPDADRQAGLFRVPKVIG